MTADGDMHRRVRRGQRHQPLADIDRAAALAITAAWRPAADPIVPAGAGGGRAFYRVIDTAYEKRSVALTSNLHPAGFDTVVRLTQVPLARRQAGEFGPRRVIGMPESDSCAI